MHIFEVILMFVALAGLDQTYGFSVACTCSDLKHEHECGEATTTKFYCIWDPVTSTCSQIDCESMDPFACSLSYIRNKCVYYNNKCQDQKQTCAEYISDTQIQLCVSPYTFLSWATEERCEVDTEAESKKCKKTSTLPACKSYTTKDTCDTKNSLPFIYIRRCYFDDSKTGGDEDPKCLENPPDCSGTLEAACEVPGCTWNWREEKCQVKTCSILSRSKCDSFFNNAGAFQQCFRKARKCVEEDFSSLTVEECYNKSKLAYHFDGYCKRCYDPQLTNSTDSYGLTLVNSYLVGMMVIIVMS